MKKVTFFSRIVREDNSRPKKQIFIHFNGNTTSNRSIENIKKFMKEIRSTEGITQVRKTVVEGDLRVFKSRKRGKGVVSRQKNGEKESKRVKN